MEVFFLNLLVALLVGFLVGVERQISQNFTQKDLGVRDLVIVSMLGFVVSNLLPQYGATFYIVLIMMGIFSFLGFWLFNAKFSKSKIGGFTTFLVLPTVFILSSLPGFGVEKWKVLALLGVLVFTLQLKEEWHAFIDTVKDREVIDFVLFLIVLFVVSPLIPQDMLWDLGFYKIEAVFVWKIVTVISMLSFFAHFFTKYVKGKKVLIMTSFLGGLVSSVATVYLITSNGKRKEMLALMVSILPLFPRLLVL